MDRRYGIKKFKKIIVPRLLSPMGWYSKDFKRFGKQPLKKEFYHEEEKETFHYGGSGGSAAVFGWL
ncbi:MAG: hypothetical protein LBD37_10270 [Treponema sp.]|jgi:hypothetical protein|nr:hypothetical protein [Treponema sp.]